MIMKYWFKRVYTIVNQHYDIMSVNICDKMNVHSAFVKKWISTLQWWQNEHPHCNGDKVNIHSGDEMNVHSGDEINVHSGDKMNIHAGDEITSTMVTKWTSTVVTKLTSTVVTKWMSTVVMKWKSTVVTKLTPQWFLDFQY